MSEPPPLPPPGSPPPRAQPAGGLAPPGLGQRPQGLGQAPPGIGQGPQGLGQAPQGIGLPPPGGTPSFAPPTLRGAGSSGSGTAAAQPSPSGTPWWRGRSGIVAAGVAIMVAITLGVVVVAVSGGDSRSTSTTERTAASDGAPAHTDTTRARRTTTVPPTRPATTSPRTAPATRDSVEDTGAPFSIPPLTDPPSTGAAPSTSAGAPSGGTVPIGATVDSTADHLRFTVLDMIDDAPAGEFSKPAAGDKFVAIRINVANTGAGPANTFADVSATLIDAGRQRFNPAFTDADVGPSYLVFTIPAGDMRSGWLTFEVPEASSPQRFQWQLDRTTAEWDLLATRQAPSGLAAVAPPEVPLGSAATVTGADDVPFELTADQVVDDAVPSVGSVEPGTRLVAVQVTYHNVGNARIDEFAEGSLTLIDPDGQELGPSFLGTAAGPGFDGDIELAPGESRTGFVTFEVPRGVTPVKMSGTYLTAEPDVLSMALS